MRRHAADSAVCAASGVLPPVACSCRIECHASTSCGRVWVRVRVGVRVRVRVRVRARIRARVGVRVRLGLGLG